MAESLTKILMVMQELPHIICTVLGFNELDTLFAGGTGAGKIYDGLHWRVRQTAETQ